MTLSKGMYFEIGINGGMTVEALRRCARSTRITDTYGDVWRDEPSARKVPSAERHWSSALLVRLCERRLAGLPLTSGVTGELVAALPTDEERANVVLSRSAFRRKSRARFASLAALAVIRGVL
jgi:hypothetical protein